MGKDPKTPFNTAISNKAYDIFLDVDEHVSRPELIKCKELYRETIQRNITQIEFLAKLEETIIQIRCQELAFKEVKLSNVRGYIYARSPFIKNGSNMKDLRLVVGKTDEYGNDLNVLLADEAFVIKAKKKIVGHMAIEIAANLMVIEEFEEKLSVII